MIWTLKKCNKTMDSSCLFTRQRALKMGYFCWLRFENSNHLHTELSLGYLVDAKFYLESKASFIDMSSIASFKLFLLLGCGNIVLFWTAPWLVEVLALVKIHPVQCSQWEPFSTKKSCSTIKLFFFFKYVLY